MHFSLRTLIVAIALAGYESTILPAQAPSFPSRVPPKRSPQIEAGFGINSDLPRDPYLPWNRWW